MTDTFWGLREIEWVGLESISLAIGTVILIITGWFWYLQVRQGTRANYFDAVVHMQKLIDELHEEGGHELFHGFPIHLVMGNAQFVPPPMSKYRPQHLSEKERQSTALSRDQVLALEGLTADQKQFARYVINRINDLGQLVEDRFLPKDVFFGKHHLLVLRCCSVIEPIRRRVEMDSGGNYGQRILRIRHRATVFNDIYARHREVPVFVVIGKERVLVYQSPEATILRRLIWMVRRRLRLY